MYGVSDLILFRWETSTRYVMLEIKLQKLIVLLSFVVNVSTFVYVFLLECVVNGLNGKVAGLGNNQGVK